MNSIIAYTNNKMTRLLLFILLLWIIAAQTACKKQNDPPAHVDSNRLYILDQLAAKTDYTLLHAALIRCGLDTLLNDRGAYTLLAPNDASFQSAGLSLAAINQLDKQQLAWMMKYLVLPGIVSGDTLRQFSLRPRYPLMELWNMDGLPLPFTAVGGATYLGANPLTMADSMSCVNGTIFPISYLPQAPTGNLHQLLQQTGCNFMLAAIDNSNMAGLFTQPLDTIAVLAPTDQAFINAGYPDIPSLIAQGPTILDKLIKAHLIAYPTLNRNITRYDPYSPTGGYSSIIVLMPAGITRHWIIPGLVHNGKAYLTPATKGPDLYLNTLAVQLYGPFGSQTSDLGFISDGTNYSFYRQTFTNNDSATIAKVVTPNIVATNGLIHTIDHVLPMN